MRFLSLISALAAITGLAAAAAHPPALLETRETCSTPQGSGTCMSTSSCGTFSVAGYCSGGTSNQCCVSQSCSTPSGSGTCKSTSKTCSGSYVSGYCPGSTGVQCCVSNSCSTPSGSGTCKSTSSCSGMSLAGYCPGAASNQCCITGKTCSTSSGSGTCKNTANGCSGGSFIAGACPGSSSVECCVPQTSTTCSTPSGSGKCQSTSSCQGFSLAGYCSGGADNQCCIPSTKCSTSQGAGTCKNTGLGCSGGAFVSGACPGSSTVECCVPKASTPPPPPSGGNLPGLDATQTAHAKVIIGEVTKRNLGRQGCLAGIATAYVESSIHILANNAVPASLNYPNDGLGSDHDSIGIFQQRVAYYPDVAADMDAAGSADQFFTKMVGVSGWQTMDVGTLCQTVQGSAVPDAYNNKGLPIATPVCDASGF